MDRYKVHRKKSYQSKCRKKDRILQAPITLSVPIRIQPYRFTRKFKDKNMPKDDYYVFLNIDLSEDNFEKIYTSPKVIKVKNKIKVLAKRLETFFEFDRDVKRAENIQKAYDYGYRQADIANFLNLSSSAVSKYIK